VRRTAAVIVLALGAAVPAVATAAPTPPTGIGYPIPRSVIEASAVPGSTYQPGPARFGVQKVADQPVTMKDGTVLRADVYYPTDLTTGERAAGPFPVAMTQTPYGKGVLGASPSVGGQTGPNPYLVQHGYIDVVADVRGTGDSEGEFGLFDPVQDRDGVALVRWASKLPGSDAKVGLYGASYLGIDQLLTAAASPKNSPLKAIFPVVPGNDLYKDVATMGGLIDMEFDAFYLALTGGLNTIGPILEGLQNPAVLISLLPALIAHLQDLGTFDAAFAADTLSGGAPAFDGTYWKQRNPVNALQRIVDNNIPAYLVGGEYDLFQRGEPLDFSGLQNAWTGRPVTAPMSATQPVTGRYQLLDGPFTHLSGASAQLNPLMLEWFDTWLKGVDTGMGQTPTPLHYYDLGRQAWTEHARYPFENTVPTRYYFTPQRSHTAPLSLNDHSLSLTRPTSTSTDRIAWSPVGNPCGRPSDQWAAGIPSLAFGYVEPATPCVDGDDRLGELGLDRATYTTQPLTSAKTIAGPIDVTVYATANRPDTQWVAQVQDVAPDGTSIPLTEGALLGSLRAVSSTGSWRGADGQLLLPNHPYTQASQRAVTPGQLTRYDIEVFPTYATIAASHRIRITLSTADTPHLVPTVPALADLAGGVYSVRISPSHGSAVELPLIPAG
jgi:uncharacterized protein